MLKYNNKNRFLNGEIQFRVWPQFATSIIPAQFTQVPYKIVYSNGDLDPLHIFNCSLNVLGTLISVVDITPVIRDDLSKADVRYLLGRTIEAAENLAKSLDKVKVVVSTNIEAIVDVFVERDYVHARRHRILGFKGVKGNLK